MGNKSSSNQEVRPSGWRAGHAGFYPARRANQWTEDLLRSEGQAPRGLLIGGERLPQHRIADTSEIVHTEIPAASQERSLVIEHPLAQGEIGLAGGVIPIDGLLGERDPEIIRERAIIVRGVVLHDQPRFTSPMVRFEMASRTTGASYPRAVHSASSAETMRAIAAGLGGFRLRVFPLSVGVFST